MARGYRVRIRRGKCRAAKVVRPTAEGVGLLSPTEQRGGRHGFSYYADFLSKAGEVVKIAPEIVAALCRKHAPDLLTPASWQGTPIDKIRLLWGVSGVESSFGLNCNPRHEMGYCYGGRYLDTEATKEWGCLAHCSFGPWQVMYNHFPVGVSPLSLVWESDGRVASETCLLGAIRVLNQAIARGARHLSDIVVAYNGPASEEQYSARLAECLDRPMPEVAGALSA